MNSKKSITILIAIIGLLLMLLAGTIGYIMGNPNTNHSESNAIIDDKKVMQEIEELKKMYDSKIADKTNTYNALEAEREKVQLLVSELEKSKNDAKALIKYKTEYQSLESKMRLLVDEIVVLKNKKTNITIKQEKQKVASKVIQPKIEKAVIPVTIPVKKEVVITNKSEPSKTKTDDFFGKKEQPKQEPEVKKTITIVKTEKPVKVSLSNVKAGAYVIKSVSKLIETNAAGKADLIKINFTLNENQSVTAGEKTLYIQIIDGKNNVLGRRITEYFDNQSLTYSLTKAINYDNQQQDYSIEFVKKDFEKGTYFISIFDRDELVGRASFTLK
ncbi:hypothetical protein [Flavobacterium sp.]|uniref:hypothetical protein n=1 Tax=Flavobacterium sp. TaxID=239 RepID=UPI0026325CE0|nr:hypothetical protein [Flavobacterium sp.]